MNKTAESCNHWAGDHISGYWLCANCFAKLSEQPRRYYTEGLHGGDTPARQAVILAPVAESQGYTLAQFIEAMALCLISRISGGIHKSDAIDYAIDILRIQGEPFGSGDPEWTIAGFLRELDEDLQYWDSDGPMSN